MIPNQKDKIVYFIRHARSTYNQAEANAQLKFQQQQKQKKKNQEHEKHEKQQKQIQHEHKEQADFEKSQEYLKLKFQSGLWDCDLVSPLGQQQCQQCMRKLANVHVDLVIVSPLRRALKTCELVAAKHHNKPLIIVDPAFREIAQSVCDIGSQLRECMKDFPNFDYSLIDNVDYWYIDCMNNQQKRTEFLQKIEQVKAEQQNQVARNLFKQYLKELWAKRQGEPSFKIQALPCLDLQKKKLRQLFEVYNSIAVVTHSQNIKSFTGIKIPNCSIIKYQLSYFYLPVNEVPHNFL